MNWYVFENVINLYQGLLMLYFVIKRFDADIKKWIRILAAAVLVAVVFSFLEHFELSRYDDIVFIIPFLYALLFTKGRLASCILWTIVLCLIFTCSVTITGEVFSIINNVSWEMLMESSPMRVAFVVSNNILITIIVVIVSRIGKPQSFISVNALICFLILLFTQLGVSEMLYTTLTNGFESNILTYCSLGMMLSVVLTVILYELMTTVAEDKRKAELKLKTTQLTQAHQEELRSIYSNMLVTQHDLRHRISLAEQILQSKDETILTTEAAKHIGSTDVLNEFITGNVSVDAVLTAKATIMEHAGIEFVFAPYPLLMLPISECDFCVLISNLLDNAIEGVMRLPASAHNRKIEFGFSRTWDMFSIECVNDMEISTIHKRYGEYISSKENVGEHGFGLKSIRETVTVSGGWLNVEIRENKFHVEIMIPMEDRIKC